MAEPLGETRLEIGLDDEKFGSELDRVKKKLKYSMAAMKADMSSLGQGASAFDKLSVKQKGLTDVMQKQAAVVKSLKKAYDQSFDQNGKATRATAGLATQYETARAKLGAYNSALVQNAKDMAKAKIESTGFTGQLNSISKSMQTAGAKMSNVGSKMTTGVTVPVVAGLGAAVKMAVDFDSQIEKMGPLLTNGGTVTAKFRQELDQLGDSSKKWASKYGISTTVINDGMTELIKRGFDAQQTLGAMPNILDATVASGEDLGVVMNTTASIMEQFGLKGKTAAETMKNTQRVTDSLTYAANATASGFSDMGEAMSYAGPQASALGISVEQTAAAIGVLSNMGIEGEKAGTNLRGMLTSLVKPTDAQTEAFKEMGLSTKQLQKDSSNLPALIADLEKGTKGLGKAEKARLIAQAFGKQNQSAVNALIKAGSGALKDLTKETENATGATKKVAEQMSNTKANQIKRTVENIKQMGITIGQQLLPLLPPLLKNINDIVSSFKSLDKGTQQNILKWVALAAAMGPVLKIGGNITTVLGGMGRGVVGLVSKIAQLKAGKSILTGVAEGANVAASSAGALTTATAESGAAMGTMASGATAAGVSLGSLATGLGIIAGAVVLGYGAWKLWGERAYDSANRTSQWGTDVGAAADTALDKMSGFQRDASQALKQWDTDTATSSTNIQKSFHGMTTAAEEYAKAVKGEHKDTLKGLDPNVQSTLEGSFASEEKKNADLVKNAKETEAAIKSITSKAAKEKRSLTSAENEFIIQASKNTSANLIQVAGLTASEQKKVQAAYNRDVNKMNKEQMGVQLKDFTKTFEQVAQHQKAQQDKLRQAYSDGIINKKQLTAGLKEVSNSYDTSMKPIIAKAYELQKAMGNIGKDGKANLAAKHYFDYMGISADDAKKAFDDLNKSAKEVNTTLASSSTNKAGRMWNFDFLYDANTGLLRTKQQLKDFLAQTIQTADGWNNIKLVAKKAKLGVDGATVLNKTIADAGKWNDLSLKTQKALINAEYGKGTYAVLQYWVENKTLPAKTFEMLAKGDITPILTMIDNADLWNSLPVKEKKILVSTPDAYKVLDAIAGTKEWNALTYDEKSLIVNASGTAELGESLIKLGLWNSLDAKTQKLIANDEDFQSKLTKAKNDGEQWAVNWLKKPIGADTTDFTTTISGLNGKQFGTGFVGVGANTSGFSTTVGNLTSGKPLGTGTISVDGDLQPIDTKMNTLMTNPMGLGGLGTKTVPVDADTTDATNKIEDIQKKADDLDGKKSTITVKTNANGSNKKIKDVTNSWKDLVSQKSTKNFTTTYKTVYETEYKTKGKKGKATGTQNWDGGLVRVNDQLGSKFREMIQMPNGLSFIPQGRNVDLNLPKGTKIFTAAQTKRIFPDIKQFAKGNVPNNAEILQIADKFNSSSLPSTTSNNGEGLIALAKVLTNKLDLVIEAVNDNKYITPTVELDGVKVSRQIAPEVSKQTKQLDIQNNRLKGILK